jgi:hypothetical protein
MNMVKVEFSYGDGTSESLIMTGHEASAELQHFLNRYSDSGKKQWMAKMKGKDMPCPWQDNHYYGINAKHREDNGLA